MRYITHVLIALTQMLNALLWGFPDESTSSRAHRQQHRLRWRIARRVINALFFTSPDHCLAAYEAERRRRQYPPELRDVSQVGSDQT